MPKLETPLTQQDRIYNIYYRYILYRKKIEALSGFKDYG